MSFATLSERIGGPIVLINEDQAALRGLLTLTSPSTAALQVANITATPQNAPQCSLVPADLVEKHASTRVVRLGGWSFIISG